MADYEIGIFHIFCRGRLQNEVVVSVEIRLHFPVRIVDSRDDFLNRVSRVVWNGNRAAFARKGHLTLKPDFFLRIQLVRSSESEDV